MPMTANIIHTMKQTVNAVVLATTTDHCLYCSVAMGRPLPLLP
jgi:hypothetical protein